MTDDLSPSELILLSKFENVAASIAQSARVSLGTARRLSASSDQFTQHILMLRDNYSELETDLDEMQILLLEHTKATLYLINKVNIIIAKYE